LRTGKSNVTNQRNNAHQYLMRREKGFPEIGIET